MFDLNVLKKYLFYFLLVLSSACHSSNAWDGDYVYEVVAGNSVGGSVISTQYKLNINKSTCLLSIDGFQVEEKIKCHAAYDTKILNVKFSSYLNGSTLNEFGVAVYAVNDTLFSIVDTKDGLITKWASEKPSGKLPLEGYYFKLKK